MILICTSLLESYLLGQLISTKDAQLKVEKLSTSHTLHIKKKMGYKEL